MGCGAIRPEVTAVTRGLSRSSDGALHGLPAVWLRDNCPCSGCRDAGSGQRLVAITDQPADVWVEAVRVSAHDVGVVFGPDGHEAVFAQSWLAEQERPQEDGRCEDAKRLWTAGDLAARIPQGCWPRYLAETAHRAECLEAILGDGFVLLRDVPCEPGAVLTVAGSMGFVRETNYGRLFDVRAEATPANLACTGLPIAPHTDNPYRDPVPTVQLLHCLAGAVDGADTGLVDGFRAAGVLRGEDPAAFEILAGTPVTFAYSDATAELRATGPMIGLDPRGRIRAIRFNNRSMQPPRCGSGATSRETAAEMASFYAAYRAFAGILIRPELMLTFRLTAGDCVIFDNTRILHARTGFATAGRRHLQGCYADLDGVGSALAVYRRDRREGRGMRSDDAVEMISAAFASEGAADYLGEPVSQAVHMLQAAALAERDGADGALIAAALLHDVGHFTGTVTGRDLMDGTDDRHSATGASWLSQWFGAEVTEPVRLHVDAKRYLCAVVPGYAAGLSPASVYTLGVQGGPMRRSEFAAFEASSYAAAACRVRRWDDAAKDPEAPVPPFDHFRPLLRRLARQHAGSRERQPR
jgi:gamma-butyrobetaine dioxygenase